MEWRRDIDQSAAASSATANKIVDSKTSQVSDLDTIDDHGRILTHDSVAFLEGRG